MHGRRASLQEPLIHGFVVTASGPKADWEARVDPLIGWDFDVDRCLERMGDDGDSLAWAVWQVRRR